jgi:hypothetical protein
MFWVLVLDTISLFSFQWAPFDGPRNANLAMQYAGIISLPIYMFGYFFAILIGAGKSFFIYVVMFVIGYVELMLLGLGIGRGWKAIRT